MSASPNRTVSKANRSASMVRKVDSLHRGSDAIAPIAEATPMMIIIASSL